MEELQKQHCEVCRSGAPPATAAEIAGFLSQLPQWRILSVDGIDRLREGAKVAPTTRSAAASAAAPGSGAAPRITVRPACRASSYASIAASRRRS